MTQADAWRMIRRRAAAAGIMAPIGNHTFRATGITAYLGNNGTPAVWNAALPHFGYCWRNATDRGDGALIGLSLERRGWPCVCTLHPHYRYRATRLMLRGWRFRMAICC